MKYIFILIIAIILCLISLIDLKAEIDAKNYIRLKDSPEFEHSRFRPMVFNSDILNEFRNYDRLTIRNLSLTSDITIDINLTRTKNIFDAQTKFYRSHEKDESPDFRIFIGTIKNKEKSKIVITVSNNLFFGMFTLDNDVYFISPSQNNLSEYIITDTKQLGPIRTLCGNDSMNTPDEILAILDKIENHDKPLGDEMLELELALETDTEFFKATGSDYEKARAYILTLITQMSMIYQEFINVSIKLTWLKIWTDNPSDPYDAKGDYSVLLERAIPYWNNNYNDVDRDLYHVCTSINYGGGGFGYFDALCDNKNYGMSVTSLQGWNQLPTFDFSYDLYILSHEIGHNFNAQHTHSCFWNNAPLDTCVVDNNCLTSEQKPLPNPGSIMSYCGGINNEKGFGYQVRMIFLPENIRLMRTTAESAHCLSPVAEPVLTLLTPHGEEKYSHSSSIDITWKTVLVEKIDIKYSEDNGISWFNIAEGIDTKSGKFFWTIPEICSNEMLVKISSSENPEINSTSLLTFTVTMDDPYGLVAFYPFDGNTNDEQLCHFYDASGINNPTPDFDRLGNTSAYSFNGSNYLEAKDFDFTFDSLTVCFWFMLDGLTGKQNLVGTNYQEGWIFETYYWGQLGLSLYLDGKGSPEQLWAGWLDKQKWYYSAFTFDGKIARFFVDGVKKAEKIWDNPTKLNKFRTPLYMGARKDNDFLNGKLDDIRIYKRALSEEEILGLTNVGDNTKSNSDNLSIFPNPTSDFIEVKINNVMLSEDKNQVPRVKVFNVLGSVIVSLGDSRFRGNDIFVSQEGEMIRIDVSQLSPGVYFVQIGSRVQRFVKL